MTRWGIVVSSSTTPVDDGTLHEGRFFERDTFGAEDGFTDVQKIDGDGYTKMQKYALTVNRTQDLQIFSLTLCSACENEIERLITDSL